MRSRSIVLSAITLITLSGPLLFFIFADKSRTAVVDYSVADNDLYALWQSNQNLHHRQHHTRSHLELSQSQKVDLGRELLEVELNGPGREAGIASGRQAKGSNEGRDGKIILTSVDGSGTLDGRYYGNSIGDRQTCGNTIQGRDLITDERGFICSRRELDVQTGCCPAVGTQFSCTGCNQTSKCCSVYEYCVACCQDPQRTPPEVAVNSAWAAQSTAGRYGSLFEYCRGQCRHSSLSVVHENSYGSEQHHCYRLPPPPLPPTPPEDEDSLEGLTIVVGGPGQSCDAACATSGHHAGGSKCKETKLRALNKCQVLQKFFPCRGACVGSMGPDQPAEVVATAPKHLHPGACLFTTKEAVFSCTGAHAYTRRLCPCSPT